jgi:hypothetical protein
MESSKIYNSHRNNRIKDMGEKELDFFLTDLQRKCKQAGLSLSDSSIIEDLPKFMADNFPKNSGTDIITCLELYMAGDIDLKDQVQFNLKFLGKLLNAYTPILKDATKEIVGKVIDDRKRISPPDQAAANKNSFDILIKDIRENKCIPRGWNWLKVFNHMHDAGLIEWDDAIENNFYQRWKQLQLSELKQSAKDQNELTKGVLELNDKSNLEHRLRSEYIKFYLKNNINEIINGSLFPEVKIPA